MICKPQNLVHLGLADHVLCSIGSNQPDLAGAFNVFKNLLVKVEENFVETRQLTKLFCSQTCQQMRGIKKY